MRMVSSTYTGRLFMFIWHESAWAYDLPGQFELGGLWEETPYTY